MEPFRRGKEAVARGTGVEMPLRSRPSCGLCSRAEETSTTGPLGRKGGVTAHQNCLLFSSGIFCTNSPEFSELFGFNEEDVKLEVKRGHRLMCKHCGQRGATAGCENGRCKRSFHYPCAVEGESRPFEERVTGRFGLYCSNCKLKINNPVNGSSTTPSGAGPSKVFLVFSKPPERSKSLPLLNSDQIAPSSKKKKRGRKPKDKRDPLDRDSAKRRRSDGDAYKKRKERGLLKSIGELTAKQQQKQRAKWNENSKRAGYGRPLKKKRKDRKRIVSDDSSDTDFNGLLPPLESDLDESETSLFHTEPAAPEPLRDPQSVAARQNQNPAMAEIGDEDVTIIPSDADSESLLPQARTSSPEPPRVIWAETGVQTIKFEELSPRQSPVLDPEQPSSGPPTPEESPAHDLNQPSGPPTPEESLVYDLDQPSGPPTPQESPVHDLDQPSGPPTLQERLVHDPDQPSSGPSAPQQSSVHDQEQCNNGFPAPQQSPVHDPGQCSSGPLAHKESPVHGVQYSPEHVNCCSLAASPPSSSSMIPPAEPVYMTLSPSPSPPPAPASHPESGSDIDSSLFWRSCNTVGCTRAIVDGFMSGMNEIFGRVQTEQASQEDYDRALAVITASGRLAEFVDRQQKELQRKQTELQRAAEALQTVVSTLKR
ncbi:uncharacterized protein LOC133446208 isoform X2 [Cololabis saira]|uniref:uncharacterized protein LOC133446208 isoform X2 n=1 Tax=Cololabis saira TaxID=129043 RepID=UPI002AD4E119|nr:uncharacterized protein LOC133446208 isoform X2 [Cololabis saira]